METTFNFIGNLYSNPDINGHALVAPTLFYGSQVKSVFAELPGQDAAIEVARRLFLAVVAVATVPLAAFAFSISLIGLAIKFFNYVPGGQPSTEPKPEIDKTKEPVKPTEDSILVDARGLYQELVQLFDDLENLHKGKGEALTNKIKAFEVKNANLDKSSKAAKIVAEVKSSLEKLKGMKSGLFLTEPTADENGVVKVPSDGNCLFHSLLLGLKLMESQLKAKGKWDAAKLVDHLALRKAAVDWMRDHHATDRVLQKHISDAIEAFKFTQTESLAMQIRSAGASLDLCESSEQRQLVAAELEALQEQLEWVEALVAPESYFDLVSREGVFGSTAEMYAISEIFQINVDVTRDVGGGRLIEGFDLVNPKKYPLPSLQVIHYGDHFNAKINFSQ